MRKVLIMALALWCAGCSQYGYRYQPHPQNPLNHVFADYKVEGGTVDILVDTNGLKLLSIFILKPRHDARRSHDHQLSEV